MSPTSEPATPVFVPPDPAARRPSPHPTPRSPDQNSSQSSSQSSGQDARRGSPPGASSRRHALRLQFTHYLFAFGEQLFSWEMFTEAADLFRYLASRLPSQSWTWFWLARCHEELGDPLGAARYFELANRAGGGDSMILLAARSWIRAGYPEQARSALARCPGVWP